MALNNMGVGFNFTGRDSGLNKAIGSVKSGFSGLAGAASGAVKSVSMLSAQALTQRSSFATAAHDMGVTTTTVEQFGIAADAVTSRVFAGMGHMSMGVKKAKQMVTSMAYGMNRDAGTIAESMKAVEQQGIDITKIGFKDWPQFVKFMDVTGTDAKSWAAAMGHLKKEVGFTDAELADLNKTTVAIGTRFNLGTEAMGHMVSMTESMQQASQGLFITWGKDRTRQFLQSGTALAGLLMKAGTSADKAQMLATNLTKTVVEGKNSFQGIYSGLSSDLGSMATVLGENFGDINQSFALLQKDPMQFAVSLNKAFQKIKASGKAPADLEQIFARFSMQLAGQAGPELADFITHGITPMAGEAEALAKQLAGPNGLAGKNGAISKISKAFRSGLTPAQQYDRILDQFQTRLKRVAGINDNQFNKSLRESGKEMTKNLVGMKSKYKGIGKFFDMAIEVQNHGFGGLLGNLDKSFLAMNMLTKNMGPVGAGITNLGMMFYKAGKGGEDFRKKMANIRGKLASFGRGVGEFVNDMIAGFKVLWPEMQRGATDALIALNKTLGGPEAHSASEAIRNIFDRGINYLRSPEFRAVVEGAWNGFKHMLLGLYNALAGDKLQAKSLGDAVAKLWMVIKPKMKLMLTGLMFDMFQMLGEAKIPGISGIATKAAAGLATSMANQKNAMSDRFDIPSRTMPRVPNVMIPTVRPGDEPSARRPRPSVAPANGSQEDLADAIHNPEHAKKALETQERTMRAVETMAAQQAGTPTRHHRHRPSGVRRDNVVEPG